MFCGDKKYSILSRSVFHAFPCIGHHDPSSLCNSDHRYRHTLRLHSAQITIQGQLKSCRGGTCDSGRHPEDCTGSKCTLIIRSVQPEQGFVDILLIKYVPSDKLLGNMRIYDLNHFLRPLRYFSVIIRFTSSLHARS